MCAICHVCHILTAGNASEPSAIASAIESIASAISKRGGSVHVCHVLHALGSSSTALPPASKWPPLDTRTLNPQVDALNRLIDGLPSRVARCSVVPIRMPLYQKYFDRDGLHLSQYGYHELCAQLERHVPTLRVNERGDG